MAAGVLDLFQSYTTDKNKIDMLLISIPSFNIDALKMGEIGDCKIFLSHPVIQNLFSNIWYGQNSYESNFKETVKVKFFGN